VTAGGGAGSCPRCGARVEPGQEYCLECGLRLPGGGLAGAVGASWQRRVGSRGPDWLWPVLGGLLLAAVMTGVAIWISRGSDGESPFIAATGPNTVAQPPTTTAPTAPTTTAPPPTAPPTTTAKPKPKQLVDWPQSENGYTVVIASIPADNGRAVAVRKANDALRSGLPGVGILHSDEFSTLHPGYYVIFSGIYDEQRSALRNVAPVQRLYPAAYMRQISH